MVVNDRWLVGELMMVNCRWELIVDGELLVNDSQPFTDDQL